MKKIIQKKAVLLILYFFTQNIHAQVVKTPHPYISPAGYWVVEQKKQPYSGNVIKFYTTTHELIHTETIPGRKMNLHNTQVKLKLEYALNQIIKAYGKQKNIELEDNYVAALLKKI